MIRKQKSTQTTHFKCVVFVFSSSVRICSCVLRKYPVQAVPILIP